MGQYKIYAYLIFFLIMELFGQSSTVARVKYSGGGDWYGNQTTFKNIFNFIREEFGMDFGSKEEIVSLESKEIYQYPLLYIAGHGNIKFNSREIINLRNYLLSGGFLWADDDYGMDKAFRREIRKVFPDAEWMELPFSHELYKKPFSFPNGLPKIHEHNGGPPKGLALFYKKRMVIFYSFNTDISDGCESPEIHQDPPEVREKALKFATNLLFYCLNN
ncbi:MAG: DUF4159 domain-containing protein [Calditrichia bacterium]